MRNSMMLLLLALTLAGCTRLRFVVDAVPVDDGLTETVVMEDVPRTFLGGGRAKVALIDMTGLIANAKRNALLSDGENPVARFAEALQMAEGDGDVKAVIIRLNSPGGTVTASHIMHAEVERFREKTGKPVVMLMADVAASGAFLLACAGDEIIAHPTTVTGSIGVIMQTFNFSEGMRMIGIRADAITSGPNKSMGSPFEPMPQEHRALLQSMVDEFYAGFRSIVVQARQEVSESDLDWVTDGRVITGARAAEIGLIDQTGDLHDAFARAKDLAQITAARLVKYHPALDYVGSPYATASPSAEINLLQLNLQDEPLLGQTAFYYLWDPTVW